MPDKPEFPVTLTHDGIDGTATAHSPSSLAVLEANGWKRRKSKRKTPEPDEPEQS